MNSNPVEPPKGPTYALAEGNFAACERIHEFIGATVRPIIDRNTNAMPAKRICNGLITRVHGWLRSLGKLNHPGDFQAVLSGSRALFELAVGLHLLLHEEKCSLRKLIAWQESAKLKYAERLVRHGGRRAPAASAFMAREREAIQKLRDTYWNGKHADRWTGRSLEKDAEVAERFEAAGFVDYYNEEYSPVCWHVHGNGVMGLFEINTEDFPYLCARGFYDGAHFSLVACKAVLGLFGQWDAIAEQRFAALKRDVATDKGEIWLRYNPEP